MLRQDPTECLFSFICTSNNHISRIQGMVERLCQALGSPLCQLDQTPYHDFPSLSALAGDLNICHRSQFIMFSKRLLLDHEDPGTFESPIAFVVVLVVQLEKMEPAMLSCCFY